MNTSANLSVWMQTQNTRKEYKHKALRDYFVIWITLHGSPVQSHVNVFKHLCSLMGQAV